MQVFKTYPQVLGSYIKLFYTIVAGESECITSMHRRLPDGTLDLVFNLGSPVHLSHDAVNFSEMPEASITGLYRNRNFLRYSNNVYLVGAVFQPGAAHLFVNDSLENFKQHTYPAELVFGEQIGSLKEQLRELPGESERHNLLETFLKKHLKRNRDEYCFDKVDFALRRIHESNGIIKMSALAKSGFISERNLRRKFIEFVGMSPKQYAGIIRIKSFSKVFESSMSSYTRLISDFDYADQSHFIKHFQNVVGLSPTAYFQQLEEIDEKFIHLI